MLTASGGIVPYAVGMPTDTRATAAPGADRGSRPGRGRRERPGPPARDRRGRADRGRRLRADPRRHRVLDGSDDDRGRRLLPGRRRQRRGAARLLRVVVPGRRGRRDVLRAAGGADGEALGGADAAGLHVRHQGARADDGAGDRDETAAEVHSRGAARGAPGEEPDLPEGLPGRAQRRDLADVPRGARAARGEGPARLDPAPVPEVGLPVEREPGADRGRGRAAEGLEGRGRVPQRVVAQREEPRAGRSGSSRSGRSRS